MNCDRASWPCTPPVPPHPCLCAPCPCPDTLDPNSKQAAQLPGCFQGSLKITAGKEMGLKVFGERPQQQGGRRAPGAGAARRPRHPAATHGCPTAPEHPPATATAQNIFDFPGRNKLVLPPAGLLAAGSAPRKKPEELLEMKPHLLGPGKTARAPGTTPGHTFTPRPAGQCLREQAKRWRKKKKHAFLCL